MTIAATAVSVPTIRSPERVGRLSALVALASRRLQLSARTPREVIVPLMTPILFAVVIAPALAATLGGSVGGVDYMTFVSVSTIGLLVPLSCLTAGLGVIIDRHSGARRDLIVAPISRSLIVLGNFAVALAVSGLQLAALLVAAALRGAEFDASATRAAWFAATAAAFAVAMYGVAETLANRVPTQEEYIGILPAVAIVPWFFAGSLFPIDALPAALTVVAKAVPLTHVLALLRYGLVDGQGNGLHDIWGMDNTTAMATLSLAVVVAFAGFFTAVSIRVFTKASTA